MSTSDRRLDRRRSSGSFGAGSSNSSPRPSSLPPTPPSAAEAIHADRVALAAPLQPFLSPTPPGASDSGTGISSPILRSRSSSRVFETTVSVGDAKDEELSDATDIPSTSVPDPIDEILMADMPLLPTPRPPSSSPIFCCFYAEFDIVVGPKIAFQSPKGFMDQDTVISTDEIHEMLEETYRRVELENQNRENSDAEHPQSAEEKRADNGAKAATDDDSQDASLSIFDATSEYIITGNELAGKMINLSTHNMHILTRPTAISDERYERNALLFSVGFVLSRKEDPRPFRPLLCKWADALRSMEVERHFLTDPSLRAQLQLQSMLDRLLVSLNSMQCESNLLLDPANALNLRAFQPPKPPALPVPDHAVPILVREDLLSLYDWDLAIKWISMFISGVDHARWIATKSDVDMEMVRACLRVLKHHGVIALVDMFFYSNRYEFTERASAMLAGKEPKLLQEAVEFCMRHHQRYNSNTPPLCETTPGLAIPALSSSVGRHSDMPFLPINEDVMSFPPRKGSGAGLSIGSLPSTREMPKSHTSRQQQKRMKVALAEVYCSCNRNISFADLMVSKVKESSRVSMLRRGSSKASANEGVELEGIQESSLGEDRVVRLSSAETERSWKKLRSPSESSYINGMQKAAQENNIDWKEVFEFFDHRRFATFGVVHGLLRRVHNFPRAIEVKGQDGFQAEMEARALSGGTGKSTQRRTSFRSTATQEVPGEPSASRVAAMMDGTKCDDELICEFEKPLDELLELVEASGRRKVLSIYSLGAER